MNALNHQVSEAIKSKSPELAAEMVDREFLRHPELEERYGKISRAKCLQDSGYHLAYLAEAIAAGSPALFGDYIGWAVVMLAKRRGPAADLACLLVTMQETLCEKPAPEQCELPCAYLDIGLQQLPEMPSEFPTFIATGSPDAALAGDYLQALLRGDRRGANQLILDAVQGGAAVRRTPECAGVKIIGGGRPFKIAPDLWRSIGADGSAIDGQEAIVVAHCLTSLPLAA